MQERNRALNHRGNTGLRRMVVVADDDGTDVLGGQHDELGNSDESKTPQAANSRAG